MSEREGNALVTLAKAHWPGLPCTQVNARLTGSGPTARVIGRCLVLLNATKGLDATGWCEALEPAFRKMAGGTAPSGIPYRCNLVVGPLPTERLVSEPPGISHDNAVKA